MNEYKPLVCVIDDESSVRESTRDQLAQEQSYSKGAQLSETGFSSVVGKSQALRRVLQQVEMVASSDATVLIFGETGTGKELIARAIHQRSRRRDKPLVRVNCTSIPKELFESEFFGHAKGSFKGARLRLLLLRSYVPKGITMDNQHGQGDGEDQPRIYA
jgi:transcriptional regulator with GAF, ATPase, and Fis domain